MFIHFITPGTLFPHYSPLAPSHDIPISSRIISTSPLLLGDTFHWDRDVTHPNPLDCLAAVLRGRIIFSTMRAGAEQMGLTSTSAATYRLVAGGHGHDMTQDRRTRLEAATSAATCAASPPTRTFLFLHLHGIRRTSTLPSSSFQVPPGVRSRLR